MKKEVQIAIAIFIAIVAVGAIVAFSGSAPTNSTSDGKEVTEESGTKIVLHKSPTCGCCGAYGSYLRGLGYQAEINETDELAQIKERLGVPAEVESCHTMEIEGYVLEGHLPEAAISKLLSDRPDIKGIGMAGMPQGAPGMPGRQMNDFVVYEINHDGTQGEVFITL